MTHKRGCEWLNSHREKEEMVIRWNGVLELSEIREMGRRENMGELLDELVLGGHRFFP